MYLTVIIPTFNNCKDLIKCIESIPISSDIEIIVVDDCSTDDTFEIISKYNSKKIIYKRFNKNNGVSYSRNYGVEIATGKYITFIDSDDRLILKNFNELLECIKKIKEFDLLIANFATNRFQKVETYDILNESCKNLDSRLLIKKYLSNIVNNSIMSYCWGKIYNKEFLHSNNIRFDITLKRYEDIKFLSNVLTKNPKIFSFNKKIYIYKIYSNNEKRYESSSLEVLLDVIENYSKYIDNSFLKIAAVKNILIIETANCLRKLQISSHYLKLLYSKKNIFKSINSNDIKNSELKNLFYFKLNKNINLFVLIIKIIIMVKKLKLKLI